MAKLSPSARRILADAGVKAREWIAFGGWLTETIDEAGQRTWVPETKWRGDSCGCTDDRCIGYHHDEHEECGCLPALLDELAKYREAYDVWHRYSAAIRAEDGRDDPDAREATLRRAEAWVHRHYPRAQSFSLDAVVDGVRGISVTYPGADPGLVGTRSEGVDYRQRVWSEGTDPYGYVRPEC